MAKDPICGMFVEEKEESLQVKQKGSTFYFCSSTCFETFLAPAKEFARLRRLTVLSFALGIPVFVLTWFVSLPTVIPNNFVLLILATPVQFAAGWPFYRGAWHAIRARVPNMDTLIAIGTTAAWGYSTMVTILPGRFPSGTYFDVSSLIIGFILLGKLLEYTMRTRASEAVRRLLDLSPKMAVVLKEGKETQVPLEQLSVGDLFLVRPGERIPTDGVLEDGSGAVDEKVLTGESMPVQKDPGDDVFGATMNKTGNLTVRATKVGADTTISQIVKLVEDAQAAQAPVQRLADRVASYFVPVVVIVALASMATWMAAGAGFLHGFTAFVAVLIIACPCALGLATPAAMVVGTGKGASNGILIKGGDVLETASNVNSVVFDKTGTITAGTPSVTDVVSVGSLAEEEVLGLAASAEVGSEHPIGEAMVRAAKSENLRVERPTHFEALPGLGIAATVDRRKVLVGNGALMTKFSADPGQAYPVADELEGKGRTAMLVAVDGRVEGVVAVADTVKQGARDAVVDLKRQGVKVTMLTGDNSRTANAIASEVGIDQVVSEVLPAQKSDTIAKLRKGGETVAMVGDGINDAPALAQANLGVAIGSGTDVAVETAGIVLINDDLRDVPRALKLSRATMSKIRQNLFWAFAYNIVLIPVAATGYLNPILAGIAMALSSVTVVGNSLSLNRIRLDQSDN